MAAVGDVETNFSSFLLTVAGTILEYDALVVKNSKAVEFARKNFREPLNGLQKLPSFAENVEETNSASKGDLNSFVSDSVHTVAFTAGPPSRRISGDQENQENLFGASSSISQTRKRSADGSFGVSQTLGSGSTVESPLITPPAIERNGAAFRQRASNMAGGNSPRPPLPPTEDPVVKNQLVSLLHSIDELMLVLKRLPFDAYMQQLGVSTDELLGRDKPDRTPKYSSPNEATPKKHTDEFYLATPSEGSYLKHPQEQLPNPITIDTTILMDNSQHHSHSTNNSTSIEQKTNPSSARQHRPTSPTISAATTKLDRSTTSATNSSMAPIIQLELGGSPTNSRGTSPSTGVELPSATQKSTVGTVPQLLGHSMGGNVMGKSQALFGASWCNLGTASLTDMSALQSAELKALAYRQLRQAVQVQQHLQKDVGDDGFKVINGYTILQELGRGQYGKVKLGATEDTGEMRAIKIVPKRKLRTRLQGGGGGGGDNFLREVEVMKKLKHPNIVQLHEVIDDPNSEKLYIVMQYIERGPIVAMANNGTCTALDMSVARGYMKQIVNALVYLHHKKICHCDIKPDNILLSAKGLVFLSDFGVSGMFDDPENADDPQATKGTPLFMAPEKFQRREKSGSFVTPSISPPLSPQSDIPTDSTREDAFTHVAPYDIWALGMTFYLMCCGKLPFSAEALGSLQDVAEAVLHSEMSFDVENISSYKPAKRSPTRGTDFKVRDLMSDPDSPFLQPLESIHNNDDAMASDYVPPVSFVNPGSDSINDCVEEDEELDELMFSGTDWHQSVVDEKRREWNAPGSGNSDEELLMDLLAKMLNRNPATRYDIKQVRKHPFISDKEKRLLEKRVREEKSAKDHQTNSSSSVNSIHLCGPLTPKKKEKALSGFTDKSPLGALV